MKTIGAIVLAAGGSSRLGYPKQLIEFQGSSLVRRAALAARAAGADPVVVVVGADAEKVLAAIQDLDGVIACMNPDWDSGLASSLKAGVRTVRNFEGIDGVLITVSDQPHVTAKALGQLTQAFAAGHRLVAAEYHGGLGVPALFGREFLDDLDLLSGDRGAGSWLRERASEVTPVAVSGAALDIDTEGDVQKLREYNERRHQGEQ